MSSESGLYSSSSNAATVQSRVAVLEKHFENLLRKIAKIPATRWLFIIRLILVIVLSASLAKLFWLVFPTPKLASAVISFADASISAPVAAGGTINIEQLKSLKVFGQSNAKQTAPTETQAADTSLNLMLLGVMTNSDEKDSFAIISIGDKQDLYGVGTNLPAGNNVTLTKVLSDRVIISNNGQAETLWLYGKDSRSAPTYAASPTPAPPADYEDESRESPPVAQAARSLADVITGSVERDKSNGQMLGYRIRPGRDAAKFQQLGLMPDDLVTGINGVPLNSPAKLMEIYKSMGNTVSANLEVKRNGTVMTIPVRL